MQEKEHVYVSSRNEWRTWLTQHHAQDDGIWLVFDKGKHRTISYDDIVEEAMCFGWVDSRPGKVDEQRSKLYISPRKPKSAWSKSNKERIKQLSAQGKMHEAGLLAVDLAKKNGAWDVLNKSDKLEIPAEMAELFEIHPQAKKHYEAFTSSSKRIILEWIYSAKRDETRIKRIKETVEKAEQNIKANHQQK